MCVCGLHVLFHIETHTLSKWQPLFACWWSRAHPVRSANQGAVFPERRAEAAASGRKLLLPLLLLRETKLRRVDPPLSRALAEPRRAGERTLKGYLLLTSAHLTLLANCLISLKSYSVTVGGNEDGPTSDYARLVMYSCI